MGRNPMLLAGDIGGTETDLAIFSDEAGPHAPLVRAEARSAGYPSLQTLAKDPSVVIIASAVDPHNTSKLCAAAIDMFVSILASEAANLALKIFATGGVYLAGGVPLHALSALQTPRFMESFKRKGRFGELTERIPVRVVTTRAALIGAAAYGLERLKDGSA